jgi:hypothetical protein
MRRVRPFLCLAGWFFFISNWVPAHGRYVEGESFVKRRQCWWKEKCDEDAKKSQREGLTKYSDFHIRAKSAAIEMFGIFRFSISNLTFFEQVGQFL